MLSDAGLTNVGVDMIRFDYAVPSAQHLWDGLLGGTMRTSSLVLRQPEETRQRIRKALDQSVRDYQGTEALVSPVSVKLAHGAKPDSR